MQSKKGKKPKVKIRNQEIELINFRKRIKKYGGENAYTENLKFVILNICYAAISVFTKCNHYKIVNALYFNDNDIFKTGVIGKATEAAMSESTLKRNRNKYCLVAKIILPLIDEFLNKTQKPCGTLYDFSNGGFIINQFFLNLD